MLWKTAFICAQGVLRHRELGGGEGLTVMKERRTGEPAEVLDPKSLRLRTEDGYGKADSLQTSHARFPFKVFWCTQGLRAQAERSPLAP